MLSKRTKSHGVLALIIRLCPGALILHLGSFGTLPESTRIWPDVVNLACLPHTFKAKSYILYVLQYIKVTKFDPGIFLGLVDLFKFARFRRLKSVLSSQPLQHFLKFLELFGVQSFPGNL